MQCSGTGPRLPVLIRESIAVQRLRAKMPLTGKFTAGQAACSGVEVMKAVGSRSIAAA